MPPSNTEMNASHMALSKLYLNLTVNCINKNSLKCNTYTKLPELY